MMKATKLTLGVMAGALALGSSSANAIIFFDVTGSGAFGNDALTSFDWLPGNTIALDGNLAVTNQIINQANPGANLNTQFTNHYQAALGTVDDSGFGQPQTPAALLAAAGADQREFTVVVGFTDQVTAVTGIQGAEGNQATFVYVPSDTEYFEIYVDTNTNDDPNAGPVTTVTGSEAAALNHLRGEGYNDGELILRADIIAVNTTTFTLTDGGVGAAGPLDQSDTHFGETPGNLGTTDQYEETAGGTIRTVSGNASSTLQAVITDFDEDYFQVTLPGRDVVQLTVLNNLGVDLPFTSIDPSSGFVVGSDFQDIGLPGQAPNLNVGPGTVNALGTNGNGTNPADIAAAINGINTVGVINGAPLNAGGDVDIVFQTDTNQSFAELPLGVPEPVSATLSLMGLGALSMVTRRRRTA